MSTVVCHTKLIPTTFLRRIAATACACGTLMLSPSTIADSLNRVRDDAFYQQLIKLPDSSGYTPTRAFTIIVDTDRGNQLVAADDPNLRFNMLWMEQFKPGYRTRRGGAAFGALFRSYVKTAYKSYRANNSQSMSAFSTSNESSDSIDAALSFSDSMDYKLKISGDEVRLKLQYNY
ncbi:MAG: hypothetical protein QM709_09130 [Spongiibacteraceae bacterium]